MIKYYNCYNDNGIKHSIDMVYCEYFSLISPKLVLDAVRDIHDEYPEVRYQEHLDKKPHSKYDYYLDGVSIGGAYIDMGKYTNYDKMTNTFDILPMFQLRVNPNKYMNEEWFKVLLKDVVLAYGKSGYLRKYDYAIDLPVEPCFVKVFDSRKEPGLFKGTRYYGQAGRHGYLKIYDKKKDMQRQGVEIPSTTRVEYTYFNGKDVSLDDVYILQSNEVKEDLSGLNDTDRAIVDMYRTIKALGGSYDLKLGRVKRDKLKEYISGQYVLLEYKGILKTLLSHIKSVFLCESEKSISQDEEFAQVDDTELPFD